MLVGTEMTPDTLRREIVDFTISFEDHAPRLVDEVMRRQRSEVPDLLPIGDDDTEHIVRDATAVGVAVGLSTIRMPADLPGSPPAASAREARMAARNGVPLSGLAHSYRVGHAVFQEHLLAHAERVPCSAEALRAVTRNLFRYVDWLVPLVSREYLDERLARQAGGAAARHAQVRRLLAGEPGETFGYPIDGEHIAIVVEPGGTDEAIARIAAELGVPALTTVAPDGHVWGWLASTSIDERDVAERLDRYGGDAAAGMSVREAGGAAALAGSHRKAAIALRMAHMARVRVRAYRDVALEALVFGDPASARDFARAELGPLAEDSQRAAVLRETLRAYFDAGSSTREAARSLRIAERTVTYRLRRAEALIGRVLSERRAELEAAVRLHCVLDIAA